MPGLCCCLTDAAVQHDGFARALARDPATMRVQLGQRMRIQVAQAGIGRRDRKSIEKADIDVPAVACTKLRSNRLQPTRCIFSPAKASSSWAMLMQPRR